MVKNKTKIVCTIGPSTSSRRMIWHLTKAGMNVARLNLSHGTTREHAARIRWIRSVARDLKSPVGVLCDLPGPKIREASSMSNARLLKDQPFFRVEPFFRSDSQGILPI